MARKYVVKAAVGKYTDAQGVEKTKYAEIGSVIESSKEKGSFLLKMDTIPLMWDGWAYLSTPEVRNSNQQGGQRNNQNQQQTRQKPVGNGAPAGGGFDDMDEDIQF